MKKKAFTIIELLVAMALLSMMIAISAMVFSAAVKAYRTANATTEIMARMRNLTEQLDMDLRGLRKEGQFIIVWQPAERVDAKGAIVPNEYIAMDRLFFFADVDAQTFNEQQTTTAGVKKRISSNLSRIFYTFNQNTLLPATKLPDPLGKNRIFCRMQHLITGDADLPVFPNTASWDAGVFKINEYQFEYQTLSMNDWWNMPVAVRNDILTMVLDVKVGSSAVAPSGPDIDLSNSDTLHNLFTQGIGQFHVQVWRDDLMRWYPEYDPDGNGNHSDSDYPNNGTLINTSYNVAPAELTLAGIINQAGDVGNFHYVLGATDIPLPFTKALKFTFTIYDSKGIIPDGKTFTHIVYLK